MSFFKFIFQDWSANKGNTKGKIVAVFFRLANYAKKNTFYKILLFPYLILYKIIFEWIIGMEIPYKVSIGRGLSVVHLQAIVINKNAIIGINLKLRQSTTIGNKGNGLGSPQIGDNVDIGSNVCIIGEIIIGNNVKVGAGAVVVKDVPPNDIVVGNPAKSILSKQHS